MNKPVFYSLIFFISLLFKLACGQEKRNQAGMAVNKWNPIDSLFNQALSNHEIPGAAAIMQLCGRGLLSVDGEIGKCIPEFRDLDILVDIQPDSGFTSNPAKGEITIRQLLTHTSGNE